MTRVECYSAVSLRLKLAFICINTYFRATTDTYSLIISYERIRRRDARNWNWKKIHFPVRTRATATQLGVEALRISQYFPSSSSSLWRWIWKNKTWKRGPVRCSTHVCGCSNRSAKSWKICAPWRSRVHSVVSCESFRRDPHPTDTRFPHIIPPFSRHIIIHFYRFIENLISVVFHPGSQLFSNGDGIELKILFGAP